ncbi:MAG: hypothetical protein HUU37_05405 [Bdellovibrionales bacterium]|nr:hypothetical protein [Bdellovibrionales bacterium]
MKNARLALLMTATVLLPGAGFAQEVAREKKEVTGKDVGWRATVATLYTGTTAAGVYFTAEALVPGPADRKLAEEIAESERAARIWERKAVQARAGRDLLLRTRVPGQGADQFASQLVSKDLEVQDALSRRNAILVFVKNKQFTRAVLFPIGRGALAVLPGLITAANAAGAVKAYQELGSDIVQYRAQKSQSLDTRVAPDASTDPTSAQEGQ